MELVKCMSDFMEGKRNIKFDKNLLGINSVRYITLAIKIIKFLKDYQELFLILIIQEFIK
jgi:hypothetical protein